MICRGIDVMGVEWIISDVDGCLVHEEKSVPALEQELTYAREQLREIAKLLKQYPLVSSSVCTVRSLAATQPIIEAVQCSTLCVLEGGNVIYNPKTSEAYLLVKAEEKYHGLRESLGTLQEWAHEINDAEITNALHVPMHVLRRVSDRKTVVTFEILPYHAPPLSGQDLYDVLRESFLPDRIKREIAEKKIRVNASRGALDISVAITKRDGVEHIAQQHGISPEAILGIGDRFHSDKVFLDYCGYAGVPKNADEELKEHLKRRASAYVSTQEETRGVLDIIRYAMQQWDPKK